MTMIAKAHGTEDDRRTQVSHIITHNLWVISMSYGKSKRLEGEDELPSPSPPQGTQVKSYSI